MFDNSTGAMITGYVSGSATANGTGVAFVVRFAGMPDIATYGPLVYHIHGLPVPSDGNCTGTLGHLDPTFRGELHVCDTPHPESCQAGDLVGKHGNITATARDVSYNDLFLSTNASSPYFFGDKNAVIYSLNATRLTCANFTLVVGTDPSTTVVVSGGLSATGAVPSGTSAPLSSPSPFLGAASRGIVGGVGLMSGVVALLGCVVAASGLLFA